MQSKSTTSTSSTNACEYCTVRRDSYLDGLLWREFDKRRASEEEARDVGENVVTHDHYAGHNKPTVKCAHVLYMQTICNV